MHGKLLVSHYYSDKLLVEAEPKIWVSSAETNYGGFLSFPDSKFINRIWVE
jgi:hypothetical protein